MPFEPIRDNDALPRRCTHPEHDPPSMYVLYKAAIWVCPACGARRLVLGCNDRYTLEKKG